MSFSSFLRDIFGKPFDPALLAPPDAQDVSGLMLVYPEGTLEVDGKPCDEPVVWTSLDTDNPDRIHGLPTLTGFVFEGNTFHRVRRVGDPVLMNPEEVRTLSELRRRRGFRR